jgi:solute:Na+ symporter, SSS family
LSSLDWLVIAIYLGALFVLGLLLSRRRFASVDYFLASRTTHWPVIGLALLGSNISSPALVGLAGGAYTVGISVYDYEWTAAVVLVFFCLFLLPYVIRARSFTMPEFIERRYDKRVRLLLAMLTLFLNVFVDAAAVLYSGSLVCQFLFPEQPFWSIVLLLALAASIYATLGGLRAVIYTEAVQGVVLFAGATLISVSAFKHAGGWHHVMHAVSPQAISLIRPASDPGVPWPGLLFGIPVLGFYFWCTNQAMVQRVLSAKNIDEARWGSLFAGLLKLPILFLVVLPGTCALLLFPGLSRGDTVYARLIFTLLPPGLVGLVVAAFFAATMVTIASLLNSASTIVTIDMIKQFNPTLSDAATVRTARWVTLGLLVIAVAWAPQLQHLPSLWQYLQTVLAYAVPPAVAIFLVGMCWRGANADGAVAAMVLGTGCGVLVFLSNSVLGWTHLHFLYVAPLLTLLDATILVAVSIERRDASALPSESNSSAMWILTAQDGDSALQSRPWWQDYRVQAAALMAVTAGLVIAFA